MTHHAERIVIGGGLQGCCICLELARRGVRSVLLEQDAQLLNRASLRNEGKIHLGLVYAADPSFESASLQLQGALTFHPLLQRWLGPRVAAVGHSTPFAYLVASDSLLSADELERHYTRTEEAFRQRIRDDDRLNYLGRRPQHLTRRMSRAEIGCWFNLEQIAAAFATEELAVDTHELAAEIRTAVQAHELITVLPNHRVLDIGATGKGLLLSGTRPDGLWRLGADQVINCTWADRFRLDKMMGLEPAPGWVHRLKYRTIVELPSQLRRAPSATMVLGRYGDVVIRSSGAAYLSWYPTGMQGWSHETVPPAEWGPVCRGETDELLAAEISSDARRAIDLWYPGIGFAAPILVDAGAIVAYGATDVDDPKSQLHNRTRIGVSGGGAYISVDPGKLTTAPLFAMKAVNEALGSQEADRWG